MHEAMAEALDSTIVQFIQGLHLYGKLIDCVLSKFAYTPSYLHNH